VLDLKSVHQPRSIEFVMQQMADVGERYSAGTCAVAPNPKRGLLGHRSAWEERRRWFTEQVG
jgi:hypothetical protein